MTESTVTTRRQLLLAASRIGAAGLLAAKAGRALAQGGTYKAAAIANGGAIDGVVRLVGKTPATDQIIIGKDNHICGEGHATPDPVVVAGDGGVPNSVVALRGIGAGKPWPPREGYSIVQEKCAFHPYVQVAPPDIELGIVNKDPLLHNIHAYELIGRTRRTIFNIAQPQAGQIDRHKLDLRRGHIVEIDCDAHNWMSAWIFTSAHPYVAITDRSGRYELADVPPGTYELSAWHPVLGTVAATVSVSGRARSRADMTFSV